MATALVTGITGQDGYYLAQRLLADGDEVHGLALPGDDVSGAPAAVQVHRGDLTDATALAQLIADIAPDEIYNLAGISSVAQSWQNPLLTGLVTGLGPVAIMTAARDLQERSGKPVRVLQASSSEIFGDPAQVPQTEQTPFRPVNPYGAAKAYAHEMAACFRSEGLFVATVILYNHESPRRPEAFVTRKITAAAARIARDGEGTLAMGNIGARRDWGWAPDYVDAMVRAIRYDEPEDFIVATGETHSVEDFIRIAFARAGISDWASHIEIDPKFWRAVDVAEQTGDASKAHKLLGWEPTVGFEEVVNRMVDHDLELLAGE